MNNQISRYWAQDFRFVIVALVKKKVLQNHDFIH